MIQNNVTDFMEQIKVLPPEAIKPRISVLENHVGDFLDKLKGQTDLNKLCQIFKKTMENYGFDKIAYLGLNLPHREEDVLLISTYPTDWTDHYADQDYVNIDPVMLLGSQSVTPFTWGQPEVTETYNAEQRLLFDEATEFDIHAGMTVPIHGYGQEFSAFTVATEEREETFQKQVQAYQHQIHLMALHYHQHIAHHLISRNKIC